jgi:hypothetical protein
MERYENWMSFSFDGIEYGRKTIQESSFSLKFNKKIDKQISSYNNALFNNARIMRDSYKEPFDVMLSGGTDSEIVVRVFYDLGIAHNTLIFKLEDDLNVRDVNNAVKLCEELGIKYTVIDFNLKKFYENDALEIFEKSFISGAGRLPRLKWLEYSDNIPVYCDGEPYWKRELERDYSQKSIWKFILSEEAYSCSTFAKSSGITAICDWYEYTPDIILSYLEIPLVKKLLNDELPGKISNWSSRAAIHQTIWPELEHKTKLIGYEGADSAPGYRPEYITGFYNKYMKESSCNIYSYTQEELLSLLTSKFS